MFFSKTSLAPSWSQAVKALVMNARREGSSALAKCLLSHMTSILHLQTQKLLAHLSQWVRWPWLFTVTHMRHAHWGFPNLCFWGS